VENSPRVFALTSYARIPRETAFDEMRLLFAPDPARGSVRPNENIYDANEKKRA
jgi:hypothetical protein